MIETQIKKSRRAFFATGGAALGIGVGVATTLAAVAPGGAATRLGVASPLSDEAAWLDEQAKQLRQLHFDFITRIESRSYAAAAELFDERAQLDLSGMSARGEAAIRQLFVEQYRDEKAVVIHRAYRHNSSQQKDVMTLSEDGLEAAATFHVEVELCTPLQGDCTAAQMARLQGNVADHRWEAGRFEAKYVRTRGQWKIASLRYLAALAA